MKYKDQTTTSGFFADNRAKQNASWLQDFFQHLLLTDFQRFTAVQEELVSLKQQIINKKISVHVAGNKLLASYHRALKKHT